MEAASSASGSALHFRYPVVGGDPLHVSGTIFSMATGPDTGSLQRPLLIQPFGSAAKAYLELVQATLGQQD